MKQGQIHPDSEVQAPADVEAVLASGPKGERYTGLTAVQAAEAAAQNVLHGSVSPARVADLATNFINTLHGYAPNELPGAIKEIRDSIWREHSRKASIALIGQSAAISTIVAISRPSCLRPPARIFSRRSMTAFQAICRKNIPAISISFGSGPKN